MSVCHGGLLQEEVSGTQCTGNWTGLEMSESSVNPYQHIWTINSIHEKNTTANVPYFPLHVCLETPFSFVFDSSQSLVLKLGLFYSNSAFFCDSGPLRSLKASCFHWGQEAQIHKRCQGVYLNPSSSCVCLYNSFFFVWVWPVSSRVLNSLDFAVQTQTLATLGSKAN